MDWRWCGDRALVVELDEPSLEESNARARALAEAVRDVPGVREALPGARSLVVVLEEPGEVPAALRTALQTPPPPSPGDPRRHRLTVAYDGADLEELAAEVGLTQQQVVGLHTGPEYRVGFLGFAPGFPYLFGLAPELHVPRLATPRARVERGSVAIAGGFTGIYPHAGPGGWRIIGRTDAVLFDPGRSDPALLHPGDRVRFVAS